MKKKSTFMLFALLAATFFCNKTLTAQTIEGENKIVITIRSTTPDGKKNTSTMTVTGDEAKNFDVKKYIAEQTKDKPDADVSVEKNGNRGAHNQHFNYQNNGCDSAPNHNRSRNRSYNFNQNSNKDFGYGTFQHGNSKGFLGVAEFSGSEKTVEGVRINVTRNSGAAKAGLKDDDVILQLNKTPINSFRDISAFMRSTKAGDKVDIVVDRDGKTKTLTATLGQQQDAWTATVEQEKEACLGVYTSSESVDGQRGALVDDFTEVSAAKEVKMSIRDLITSVNGVRVKTHQDVWDEIAKYKPNEVVTIAYLRQSMPQQIKVTLKACKPKDKTDDEKVIVVPKTSETQQAVVAPTNLGRLELESFAASPNPTANMVNIRFRGQAVPTNLAFYDATGKVLFQQDMKDFQGEYNQRFDVSAYAKGLVVVKVQQGDKVFSKQIVVN